MTTGVSGRMPLSASGLLSLAERRKVARIDLAEAGYEGILYVCDLSTAQQQKVLSTSRKGKTRIYKDSSMDIDLAELSSDSGAKFLEACLVSDNEGGEMLERTFQEAYLNAEEGEEIKYLIFQSTDLVSMFELMKAQLKQPHLVRQKLDELGNVITSLVVKTVREISGMAEGDKVEEKKESS